MTAISRQCLELVFPMAVVLLKKNSLAMLFFVYAFLTRHAKHL
jgi:hypothetical protein